MEVLLEDGTVGALDIDKAVVGSEVTVELQDENGNKIEKTGIVKEILTY